MPSTSLAPTKYHPTLNHIKLGHHITLSILERYDTVPRPCTPHSAIYEVPLPHQKLGKSQRGERRETRDKTTPAPKAVRHLPPPPARLNPRSAYFLPVKITSQYQYQPQLPPLLPLFIPFPPLPPPPPNTLFCLPADFFFSINPSATEKER